MGMLRKLTSMSTAGLVNFNSSKEKQAKAALMNARTLRRSQTPPISESWAVLKGTVKGK